MDKKEESATIKPKKTFLEWIKANRTFTVALGVILLLMIVSFILAKALPAGIYELNKTTQQYEFKLIENDFPFWKFLLSPFLLFGTNAGKSVAIIVSFLFIISGVMEVMTNSQVLTYVFNKIVARFKNHKYLLLAILIIFFMAVGSLIGCYDEIVPFVPLLIILVAKFGFDKHTGVSVSLFAIAVGFSAGIFNPFLVAIPQEQAGITATFSGMWMRIVLFFVLLIFTCGYVLLRGKMTGKAELINVEGEKQVIKNEDPTLGKAVLHLD